MVELKKLPAVFYCTGSGKEPVREWLKELAVEDRRVVGYGIATAEFGWPVGMPVCRSLGKGLYEIRSDLRHGRIAQGYMVLLNGFIKKTRKTPKVELDLAVKRMKEVSI